LEFTRLEGDDETYNGIIEDVKHEFETNLAGEE